MTSQIRRRSSGHGAQGPNSEHTTKTHDPYNLCKLKIIEDKDPKNLIQDTKSSTITDSDSDEDDKYWASLSNRDDTKEAQIDKRDPKDLIPEIASSVTSDS